MAVHFCGFFRVVCPSENVSNFSSALEGLACEGIKIHLIQEPTPDQDDRRVWHIDVLANDRAGIVHELTKAIALCGGNVEELITGLESAAMSGHPLFRATGKVSLSGEAGESALRAAIEDLSELPVGWQLQRGELGKGGCLIQASQHGCSSARCLHLLDAFSEALPEVLALLLLQRA